MVKLKVNDVRTFVPSRDFDLSRQFYLALGWRQLYHDDNLALLEIGDSRFYLQNYYQQEWADNFMLHIGVEDAPAWRDRVSALIRTGKFAGVRVDGPKPESYGALVTYVWDPAGILLHFAQWTDD